MNTLRDISVGNLKRAVSIREQIEVLESELATLLGGEVQQSRRTMSASARRKIAEAQKKRWAKFPRRKMNASARAKIAAAARARWAKAKAAGKKTLKGL